MEEKHRRRAVEYYNLIDGVIKDNPLDRNNATAISKIIVKKGLLDYTVGFLRKVVKIVMRHDLDDLKNVDISSSDVVESDKRWRVEDGSYKWSIKRQNRDDVHPFTLSVEDADQLFYEYSEHGMNMSQVEIINKYNFKIWEWNSIKSTLWLYKKSNIFSPHTVENTPPELLDDMMQEKMDKLFNMRGMRIEKNYQKVLDRSYKKEIKKSLGKEWLIEKLLTEMGDFVGESKVVNMTRADIPNPKHDDIVVVLTDIHIGAKVTGLKATQDYDLEEVKRKFKMASEEINSYGAKRVHIYLLGDLIESFTGLNHRNSWKSMEWGMYGSKAVKNTFEILEEFIEDTYNIETITAIGGNHDRMTSDNKEDVQAEIADIIFYFFNRMYGDNIDIQFDPEIISREIDGVGYLGTHGHLGISKKNPEKTIYRYGNNKIYSVLLEGHKHSRAVRSDEAEYRVVTCPPFFTGNRYSEQLGYTSTAGMVVLYNNGNGIPRVDDIPLQ